jgi:hypothetical protein
MRPAISWCVLYVRRFFPPLSGCLLLLGLAACGARISFEEREPWRHEAEETCLQSGGVREGPSVAMVTAIDGPGVCGIDHPLRVAALGEPSPMSFAAEEGAPQETPFGLFGATRRTAVMARPAAVTPAATLACPMVSALDRFVSQTVQPAAVHWFNQPVVTIAQISAYSCRGMNDNPFAHISEHAFGNALDIAAFTLADGHTISVKNGWRGMPEEQGFLHDVEEGACAIFATVLAPGSNAYHEDHMHVDLMRRPSGRAICEPHALPGEAAAFLSGSGRHGGGGRPGAAPARGTDRNLPLAMARER